MFSRYKYKTELHAHTKPASGCSDIPFDIIPGIYKDLGFSALTITNHFIPKDTNLNKYDYIEYYINDFEKAKKIGEELGINVIFGVEYRLFENVNDYLIYGVDKNDLEELWDRSQSTIEDFYSAFKSDKRVIIQAHPMRNNISATVHTDGYEVFNMHPGHNQRPALASRLATDDMLITCGSDFHHFGHEGTVACLFDANPKDSFHLAELIKSKKYIFELGKSLILPYGSEVLL